ncbi:hypothetical protein [Mangrovihabitans endophyticus]|uniref:hypothetical protein n=1 Tax=Mangrovihabitans endophyticus TaxID=1751298 RepID=UPI001664BFFE|nr:hypothetical protein [Mangrovihabitans endophyticus]
MESEEQGHDAQWWAQFPEASDRFDAALVVDGLTDLIEKVVRAPLLRREARIAADTVVRHLNKPSSEELVVLARAAANRLTATVARINDRSGGGTSTAEVAALSLALHGDYPAAAAAAEPFVGTGPLLRLFTTALRLEHFDIPMTLRLLGGGQDPGRAVRSGKLIGHYSWWPSWLLRIVTERALAGTLDEETIAALDKCAYASLTPAQARLARRLLNGEESLIAISADRLEGMGETQAAARLREGDLDAVALAARLMPL